MSRPSILLLTVVLVLAGGSIARAGIPASAPYFSDAQSSYVQDATSETIGSVNMITCIMSSMSPDALVNQGPYIALIDQNVCDGAKTSASTSGTSASAAQAPNYMTTVVESTRASNSDPMIVKAWITVKQEGGQAVTVWAHINATEAPSAGNPYGVFQLDYCGVPANGGPCKMNGFMRGGNGTLSYYEVDSSSGGSQTTALQLGSVGTTTGSGSVSAQQTGNGGNGSQAFAFAYDQSYFLRSDGLGDTQCFARDASDPGTGFSVWQYGLYDSTTGARIERNSGFPIQYTSAGSDYQGYVGYYGLSLPAGAPVPANGATVLKVDYQNGTASTAAFTVATNGGRLTRYTRQSRTLQSIDKIHFDVWVGNATGLGLPNADTQYEMFWDDASGTFIVNGEQSCGGNSCQLNTLTPSVVLSPSVWVSMGGVQGWSQSLGGDLFINLSGLSGPINSSTVTVVYHVQDLVYPGDTTMPATLYCANNCPTAASLQAYFTQGNGNSVASPYVAASYNNPQPLLAAALTAYTVGNAVLMDSSHSPVVDTSATDYQPYPQYQSGLTSGRLFGTLLDAQCPDGASPADYCDYQVNSAAVYYVWQTGPGSWNQFAALKDASGNFVQFDAPLNVNFTVPSGSTYGSYGGTSIVLQYNGFGELSGIPGSCVSATTNRPVDCATPNSRYVPQFVIPYDPTATPQQGIATTAASGVTTTYLVKWLQREIRFAVKDPSVCSADNLLAPIGVQLPTAAGLKDPSSSASDVYLGTEPTVTAAPRVIQGVVEY
jgi:hypothetical protein